MLEYQFYDSEPISPVVPVAPYYQFCKSVHFCNSYRTNRPFGFADLAILLASLFYHFAHSRLCDILPFSIPEIQELYFLDKAGSSAVCVIFSPRGLPSSPRLPSPRGMGADTQIASSVFTWRIRILLTHTRISATDGFRLVPWAPGRPYMPGHRHRESKVLTRYPPPCEIRRPGGVAIFKPPNASECLVGISERSHIRRAG